MSATSIGSGVASGATGGITGYWLIRSNADKSSGNSAIVWASGSDPQHVSLPKDFLDKLGVKKASDVQPYFMGGDYHNLNDEILKAVGKLNISTDTLPQPVYGNLTSPSQILGNSLFKALNFDILSPIGVNPHKADKATKPAADATAAGVTAAASGLSGVFGFLGSLQFWKGIGLVLAGAAILVFAALEFRKLT